MNGQSLKDSELEGRLDLLGEKDHRIANAGSAQEAYA
jgi:hypothetical protein